MIIAVSLLLLLTVVRAAVELKGCGLEGGCGGGGTPSYNARPFIENPVGSYVGISPYVVPPPIAVDPLLAETTTVNGLRNDCSCPAGWAFSPLNPVFPSTCFRFVTNPCVRCRPVDKNDSNEIAILGVCVFDQRITLRKCTGISESLSNNCPTGTIPVERNGAWRCVRFFDTPGDDLFNGAECPPNSYPQCMLVAKLLTPV